MSRHRVQQRESADLSYLLDPRRPHIGSQSFGFVGFTARVSRSDAGIQQVGMAMRKLPNLAASREVAARFAELARSKIGR